MTRFIRSQAFDVFRPAVRDSVFFTTGLQHIDTVFYQEHPRITAEEVRRSLIDHDGYPPDIMVRKAK